MPRTDRFLDAEKVHTVDFDGQWFSVRGPSITPRSPQGQPVIAALAHAEVPYRFAAASADLVFVTPSASPRRRASSAEVRAAETAVGREGEPLRVYADIVVFLDGDEPAAARLGAARRARAPAGVGHADLHRLGRGAGR